LFDAPGGQIGTFTRRAACLPPGSSRSRFATQRRAEAPRFTVAQRRGAASKNFTANNFFSAKKVFAGGFSAAIQ
jgi:hypothetical protein